MAKDVVETCKVFNHTDKSIAEIEALEIVGIIKNNWRNRNVALYASDDPTKLYMIGKQFDGKMTVISLEDIGMNESMVSLRD